MATGGDPFPIWDRRNADQQELVKYTPCKRLLEEAGLLLRENLCTDDLMPHLRHLDVYKRTQMERIMHNAPTAVVVDRLIDFLLKCQVWQVHGLFRACALTGQKQLIREVGLDPGNYITEEEEAKFLCSASERSRQAKTAPQHPEPSSTRHSSHQETMQDPLLKMIVHHCKNCKRCLMRRNLYDFGKKDAVKVIDTTKCYIKIDPLRQGEQGRMIEISENDILLALPGEEHPRVIRVEGQPGTGKTALTRHIAYDWSVDFLKRVGESVPIEVGGDMLTTVVHIPARSITKTVPDAIYENLRCPEEEKPVLFGHVTQGKGTAIELDGIDEIRNEKVMKNVREYIRDRHMYGDGPQVLLTARTDLCPIDIQDIDRFITVKGFSPSQGINYIKTYLGDNQELCQQVLDYVDAHQQKLFAIITNPLRLHIFCALVSEGVLKLDGNISILKLYILLEKCLLKREGKVVSDDDLHRFYKMCFQGLLHGMREFTKDTLDKFKIAEACHVFFAKNDTTDPVNRKEMFSFPHESIFEYFAGRYIDTMSLKNKKSLLLAVCSQSAFRNLQKFVVEVILQQEQHQEELLLLMIRAIIILQHQPSKSPESESPESSESLFRKVKRVFSRKSQYDELTILRCKVLLVDADAKMVPKHLQPAKAKNTSKICRKINGAFDDNPDFLRDVKWYRGLRNGVFGHISESLEACSPEQRKTLTSKTTDHLLPCDYRDVIGRRMVHTVGGSRWAEVVQREGGWPVVHAWCPADVQEVLYKVRMAGFTTDTTWLSVHLTTYQDTWGPPDSSAFCTQAWNELHTELTQWEVTGAESKVPDCILDLGPSTPLQGLLQSEVGGILYSVWYGTIGLEELYQVYTAPHLPVIQMCVRGEVCRLHYTTIVVPSGGDKAVLSNMKDEMVSKERPGLYKPKFVTETGERYDWS